MVINNDINFLDGNDSIVDYIALQINIDEPSKFIRRNFSIIDIHIFPIVYLQSYIDWLYNLRIYLGKFYYIYTYF